MAHPPPRKIGRGLQGRTEGEVSGARRQHCQPGTVRGSDPVHPQCNGEPLKAVRQGRSRCTCQKVHSTLGVEKGCRFEAEVAGLRGVLGAAGDEGQTQPCTGGKGGELADGWQWVPGRSRAPHAGDTGSRSRWWGVGIQSGRQYILFFF